MIVPPTRSTASPTANIRFSTSLAWVLMRPRSPISRALFRRIGSHRYRSLDMGRTLTTRASLCPAMGPAAGECAVELPRLNYRGSINQQPRRCRTRPSLPTRQAAQRARSAELERHRARAGAGCGRASGCRRQQPGRAICDRADRSGIRIAGADPCADRVIRTKTAGEVERRPSQLDSPVRQPIASPPRSSFRSARG